MKHGNPPSRRHLLGQATLAVVLSYAIFAALWILLSDSVVEALFDDPHQIVRASMIKGWLFVAVTTLLLYLLVARVLSRQQAASQCVIDDLRTKQQALDLLSTVVDNTEDAIYAQDAEGRYLLFNRSACNFMGNTLTQALGNNDQELFPAEQAEMLTTVNRRILATGIPETIEGLFDTTAGQRYFIVAKRPLRDHNDQIIGTFGIARDITERKQAESVLAESEGRFRALVEQSAAGIYIMQDNRFCYVNPYFAQLAGYDSPQEIIDQISFMDLIVPEQRAMIADKMCRRMAGDTGDNHYNITVIRRDGTRIDVELHGNIIQYHGRPALIGLFIDVTARAAAEAELHQRNAELERFNRAVVGRELDMIDMKKRINALSQELRREPPYPLNFLDSDQNQSTVSHDA